MLKKHQPGLVVIALFFYLSMIGLGAMLTYAAFGVRNEPELIPTPPNANIKVIAFDNFGTVYDLQNIPRDEVRDYIRQVRRPEWAPLSLPASWEDMPAFADSADGIDQLRTRFTVVTCANAPLGMLARLAKKNGIQWDAIIPLELVQAYKPDLKTYELVAKTMGVKPSEVLIVTGNEGSPDLDVPRQLGMKTLRIRGGEDTPQTITSLAARLSQIELPELQD